MSRHRIVDLTDELPESPGFPLHNCNYCAGQYPPVERSAVLAKELELPNGESRYYGMCGNHAEVSGSTSEWQYIPGTKTKCK